MLKVRKKMLKFFIPAIVVFTKFLILTTAEEDKLIRVDDMLLTKEQFQLFSGSASARNGLTIRKFLWPNSTVSIVFLGDSKEAVIRKRVEAAAATITEANPCLKIDFYDDYTFPWEQKDLQHAFVYVSDSGNCLSTLGYLPKFNNRYIGIARNEASCKQGDIVHILLHVLGFFHMHSSADRNDYVTVDWGNIPEEDLDRFSVIPNGISRFGTFYDYSSIMHGGPFYSSKDPTKLKTLIPKAPPGETKYGDPAKMGQREKLSQGDKVRLRSLYPCR